MKNGLIVFLFLFLTYSCSNSDKVINNSYKKTIEFKDTLIENSIEDSINYENFKLQFPNLILGQDENKTGNKLSYNPLIKEYFQYQLTPEDIANGAKLELHAIGKILNYKGLDIFVVEDQYARPDEDSYDNHIENSRLIILFKDKKPILDEDNESKLTYPYSSYYWGEGGETKYNSFFDKDTTLITTEYRSASESATGYSTSINSDKKYHRRITPDGKLEFIEITKMEFLSDFYSESDIQDDGTWNENDDYSNNYPSKRNKLNIDNIPFNASENIKLPLNCYFFYQVIDGKLKIVFENMSNDGDSVIDQYIIGSSQTSVDKNTIVPQYLKCPIIIKTSDGDLEILADGKFHLKNSIN